MGCLSAYFCVCLRTSCMSVRLSRRQKTAVYFSFDIVSGLTALVFFLLSVTAASPPPDLLFSDGLSLLRAVYIAFCLSISPFVRSSSSWSVVNVDVRGLRCRLYSVWRRRLFGRPARGAAGALTRQGIPSRLSAIAKSITAAEMDFSLHLPVITDLRKSS